MRDGVEGALDSEGGIVLEGGALDSEGGIVPAGGWRSGEGTATVAVDPAAQPVTITAKATTYASAGVLVVVTFITLGHLGMRRRPNDDAPLLRSDCGEVSPAPFQDPQVIPA